MSGIKGVVYGFFQYLAKAYLKKNKPYIIGITGSVGKTSCRMVVTQTLSQYMPNVRFSTSPKNYNSELGIVLSIFEIEQFSPTFFGYARIVVLCLSRLFLSKRYDVLVLEYGIDYLGDMSVLLSVCRPDMGILTSLDVVHSAGIGGPDEILTEKTLLLKQTKDVVFYPTGYPDVEYIVDQLECDVLSFGSPQSNPNIGYSHFEMNFDEEITFMTKLYGDSLPQSQGYVTTNLFGKKENEYVVLGIEIAQILSIRLGETIGFDSIVTLEYALQPGRNTLLSGIHNSYLIDSTYNSSPKSLSAMIETMIVLKNSLFSGKKIIYCLGDMNELGDFSEIEHRKIAGKIAQSAYQIFLIGNEMFSYGLDELLKIGFDRENIHMCVHSRDLGFKLREYIIEEDADFFILLKSSQGDLYLEEALPYILKNSSDIQKVPRQTADWKARKQKYFDVFEN